MALRKVASSSRGVASGSRGVIKVKQEKEKAKWPDAAIKELLKILGKYYRSQGNDAKLGFKRILYENCSLAMREKGFNYAASQCQNKWKSLKRKYMTCFNRCRAGKGKKKIHYEKQLFDDEIEYLLHYDRPELKKDPEDTKRNSNIRRCFDEDMDQGEENDESDGNDQKYTANHEQLVQRMLRGSDDEDQKDNVFTKNVYNLRPQQKENEASNETLAADKLHSVRDLIETMISDMDANTNALRSRSTFTEKILACLESLNRKSDKEIEFQQIMLDHERIQNFFLAKILEKMGYNGKNSRRG